MQTSQEPIFINKYATWSLLMGPLLEPYYLIGTINMFKFFMLFNCVFFFIKRTVPISIDRNLKHFIIYAFTIPSLVALTFGYTSHILGSYLTVILFVLNLYLVLPFVNYEYLKRIYGYFAGFSVIIFIIQEIQYNILGYRMACLVPFFKLASQNMDMSQQLRAIQNLDRSSSIFAEPSHFAQYIVPYLAVCMGKLHSENKLLDWRIIVLSLCLLWLRSGNGILLCAVMWICFILFTNIRRGLKYFLIFPLCIVASIVFLNNISKTEIGEELQSRTEEMSISDDKITSGYIRLYRGYYIYGELNPIIKIFGVGLGGANDAIDNSSRSWMFKEGDHYLNNIQILLISYGLLGTILFFVFLIGLIRKNFFEGKLIIIGFITMSFMESFFCSPKMLMYLAIPILAQRSFLHKKYKNNE